MKKKFNLIGNTFTHLTNGNKGYSVHGKESKHIEWVQQGGEATFYIDDTINVGISDEFDVSEDIYYNKLDAIKDNLGRAKEMEILEDFIYVRYLR